MFELVSTSDTEEEELDKKLKQIPNHPHSPALSDRLNTQLPTLQMIENFSWSSIINLVCPYYPL
jgi:hypothetical protein